MLNKLQSFMRSREMVQPGDRVICAVSGGADSVALLFAMYLLRESLGISLEAAHFNHGLRGQESDADEAFVRDLCQRYDIPLSVGAQQVRPGKKGLEASARDARYRYLRSLGGKIATVHISDYDFVNERHWLPLEGNIDWAELMKGLDDIGYNGAFMYEVPRTAANITREAPLVPADYVNNHNKLLESKKSHKRKKY